MASYRKGVLNDIETDASHHLTGPFLPGTPISMSRPSSPPIENDRYKSRGFWSDLKTFRWISVPASSFKLILIFIALYLNFTFLQHFHLTSQTLSNPFAPLLFISYRIPSSTDENPLYQKGYKDLLFIGFYILVWSFVRQFLTLHVFHPFARRWGIRKQAKVERFGEQGYAVVYFSFMTIYGLAVMYTSKIWWYRTEHFWIDYPHWEMTPLMKSYYLLHTAYWSQQFIVLVLGLERPRKDFTELVIHHIVTLWLIGWSYMVNLTRIGNAVFLSMDVSDVFLAVSKIMNYLQYDRVKVVTFAAFSGIWTYFRHYLNIKMLHSVWYEFDLAPESAKRWSPRDGVWFPSWMRYQIFIPLLLLQFVNLFWYFLIWRIAIRAVTSSELEDERSDDEGGEEEQEEDRKPNGISPLKTSSTGRYQTLQNGVSNRAARTNVVKVKLEEEDD